MGLSAKRPSRGDEARQRILHEVTETTEKKKRLNAEIEESLGGFKRSSQRFQIGGCDDKPQTRLGAKHTN